MDLRKRLEQDSLEIKTACLSLNYSVLFMRHAYFVRKSLEIVGLPFFTSVVEFEKLDITTSNKLTIYLRSKPAIPLNFSFVVHYPREISRDGNLLPSISSRLHTERCCRSRTVKSENITQKKPHKLEWNARI